MTKEEVLNALIEFLRDYDAVDHTYSDVKIAQTKLPDLDIFKHSLPDDLEFKKKDLFQKMVKKLKEITRGVEPYLSPYDETIFDRDITIETLAEEIAEFT